MLIDSKINPTRFTRIAIDSRDRDVATYGNANKYVITLDEPVHDVLSMTLLVADVPFVAYMVGPLNNAMTMTLTGGSTGTVAIPSGDYSGDELAAAVGGALAAQFPNEIDTTINVVYSAVSDNISVVCTVAFTLTFGAQGSIARELGFAPSTTYASVQVSGLDEYVLIPPFRRDSHTNPSMILCIQNVSVNTATNNNRDTNRRTLDSTVNQSFAVLTPSRSLLCSATNELPTKTFNPPISQLVHISIEFKNYDGSLVDFQNHDHRLELLLTSIRSAKYLPLDAYHHY